MAAPPLQHFGRIQQALIAGDAHHAFAAAHPFFGSLRSVRSSCISRVPDIARISSIKRFSFHGHSFFSRFTIFCPPFKSTSVPAIPMISKKHLASLFHIVRETIGANHPRPTGFKLYITVKYGHGNNISVNFDRPTRLYYTSFRLSFALPSSK